MNARHSCPTNLISDKPTEEDAFGGHESVARSIAEVLQTEDGGKSIGLEGGWGTGKSSIVNFVSKKLDEAKGCDYKVVEIDTWAHQGDPLRRTFLEALIVKMQDFGWVKKENWNLRLAELTKRRRDEITNTTPELSLTGLLMAISLLITPLGLALISAGINPSTDNDGTLTYAWRLLVPGALLSILPLIVYAFAILIKLVKHKTLKPLPRILSGQTSTETLTTVTETPDPTSVEFEAIFRELLNDALSSKNRKLVLVIDNLDRVQPQDALSIWSTLQTFLGHSDYLRPKWLDHLWILIPYDHDAILRLWDSGYQEPYSTDDKDFAPGMMTASFLDKTFHLRFKTPPLLLLNWRDFLQDALKQAFPSHTEEDFRDIYRAYAIKRGLETAAPTPRDLKVFVNQIGTLHRERQDEFPLSRLACYVLIQQDSTNIHDALLKPDALKPATQVIGERWRDTIAAIHFGVPAHDARQLLLRTPIENAISNTDGTRLSDIESIHPDGFWSVLEDLVRDDMDIQNRPDPPEIATISTVLVTSQLLDNSNRQEAKVIKSSILQAATITQSWGPFDDTTSTGMVNVARLAGGSEETVSNLIAGASSAPVQTLDSSQYLVSPSVWVNSALTLIQGLEDLGFVKSGTPAITVRLNAEQWLTVSSEIVESERDNRLLN